MRTSVEISRRLGERVRVWIALPCPGQILLNQNSDETVLNRTQPKETPPMQARIFIAGLYILNKGSLCKRQCDGLVPPYTSY